MSRDDFATWATENWAASGRVRSSSRLRRLRSDTQNLAALVPEGTAVARVLESRTGRIVALVLTLAFASAAALMASPVASFLLGIAALHSLVLWMRWWLRRREMLTAFTLAVGVGRSYTEVIETVEEHSDDPDSCCDALYRMASS